MYKALLRDRKKRQQGIKLELKRSFIKSICSAGFIRLDIRVYCTNYLRKYRGYTSFVQYNNFCNITDKSRSVFRFFGIERFILRQNILKGSLNYIKYRILR
jgi:ribosomal protein S14